MLTVYQIGLTAQAVTKLQKKNHAYSPFKEQIKKKCIKGKISKNIKKENLVKIGNCITLTKSPDTNFEYSLVIAFK